MNLPVAIASVHLPALLTRADDRARFRFLEFFAAQIRNANTRRAYVGAAGALTREHMDQKDAYRRVRKHGLAAAIDAVVGNHSLRGTGIVALQLNGFFLTLCGAAAAFGPSAVQDLPCRTSSA